MLDKERVQRTVEDLSAAACRRVFEAYGVPLERLEGKKAVPPIDFLLSGIVGFAGRSLRGSIILATTAGPLDRSDPLGRSQPSRDWIGELANQVAGHVKSGLLAYGVELYVNLPAVISGSYLAPMPRQAVRPIAFSDRDGFVCLWVDVESDEDLRMSDDPDPGLAGRESGEPLLFHASEPEHRDAP